MAVTAAGSHLISNVAARTTAGWAIVRITCSQVAEGGDQVAEFRPRISHGDLGVRR
jgi:hypothetical protein